MIGLGASRQEAHPWGMSVQQILSVPEVAIILFLWATLVLLSLGVLASVLRRRTAAAAPHSKMSCPLLFLLGGVTFLASQAAAALLGGPLVRAVFGPPLDFLSDYVSPQASLQALLTQLAAALLAFAGLGAVRGWAGRPTGLSAGLCTSNPASLLLGGWAFVFLVERASLAAVPYEYASIVMLTWFHPLAGTGLLALTVVAGARLHAWAAA